MMSVEGAGELKRVAPATPPVVTGVSTPSVAQRIPIVLRATSREARGARMRVAGLRVVDRAVRRLARLRDARVLIATDGSFSLPRLAPNMEVHRLDGDVDAAVDRLRASLGEQTLVVGADDIWLLPSRPDRALKVVDRASRRAAEKLIYDEARKGRIGIVDRMINQRVSSAVTRLVLAHLPVAPVLLTLLAGFIGLYGALMITTGTWANVVLGFAVIEASILVDGCSTELSRVRLHQTPLTAWLDTIVGDFVNLVMILAVGIALWRRGGTFMDMKMALVSAGLTLVYALISYRELIRQGEGDVMKVRWWFAYGQPLLSMSGAGATQIRAVMLLGRRDVLVVLGIVLAYYDQLAIVAVYMLIVALVRATGAIGQLMAPDWRIRPHA